MIMNDKGGRYVGQQGLHLRELPEEPLCRIFQDERAATVNGENVANGVKKTGVEHIRECRLIGDRSQDTADAAAVRVLALAGAARGGGAARPAHQLDDVGDRRITERGEHVGDELGRDEGVR